MQANRDKKCRSCGEWFKASNSLHRACSPPCAIEVARMDGEKAQRKELKRRKKALKSKSDLRKEAQAEFNAFIRERDADKPCISCGGFAGANARGGDWDCGHYRSTGANPELRFCEINAHKQCKKCNQYLSGNVTNYRIGLRQRIGDAALEWLEGEHPPTNYTKADYEEIKRHYRQRRKELRRAEA